MPDTLCELLGTLSRALWAEEIWAVVSMGHLSLVAVPPAHPDRGDAILLAPSGSGVSISYLRRDGHAAQALRTCAVAEAAQVVERAVWQMLESERPGGSSDTDRIRPRYRVGQRVRTLSRGGQNTVREGYISRRTWHYQRGQRFYWIRSGTRTISKRYAAEDLEHVEDIADGA